MSQRNNGSRNPQSPMLSMSNTPEQSLQHSHHRGHKRGHSYGGPVSPTTSFHHARLEARPSHPTRDIHHDGTFPATNSALLKGHRRALSGCMPMMGGMGAVAWSSLKELQPQSSGLHAAVQGLRSRSPIEIPGEVNPTTTDGKKTFNRSLSPQPTDIDKEADAGIRDIHCGVGAFSLPPYFNQMANIRVFVTLLSLLVTLQQAVASGYVSSVITTIELRFEIPSKYTGLIASAYEMGNVVTVLFVSYLGAKRHIPRFIAVGVLIMVLGCLIFTLPHFTSSNSTNFNEDGLVALNSPVNSKLRQFETGIQNSTFLSYYNSSNEDGVSDFMNHGGKNSVCHSVSPLQPSKFISSLTTRSNDTTDNPESDENPSIEREKLNTVGCQIKTSEDGTLSVVDSPSYTHPLILFTLAQILLGIGGSPLFTLGITYVDDHVAKASSSIYIGLVYAMGAFGPVIGFLMGAWFLTLPASSAPLPDGEFIGMWWGGFLVVALLLLVVTLPFITFPRFLQKNTKKEMEVGCEENAIEEEVSVDGTLDPGYGQSIRDIPQSMLRLFKNPAYVITCLAGCMEMNIISAFVVFLPKYLETQFAMGKSEASVFTGGIAIPGAFFGILAGGYVMKRLELTPSGGAKFVVITNCICLIGHAAFFFLGCTNPKLAGATIPYPDSLNPLEYMPYNVNLTSMCNSDCTCDSSVDAQYVCHSGITYFSPCHAGCLGNMTQCTCAGGGDVSVGVCPDSPCSTLLPFMLILFFMTATVAMMQMPLLMIVLRSVSEEERSFALGMQFVLFRLLGYIPSPIIFGNVIDSACLLWSVRRCSNLLPAISGRCLRYDILDFRYKFVGILTGFKLMAMALGTYNYFQLRLMEVEDEREDRRSQQGLENEDLPSNSFANLFDESKEGENSGSPGEDVASQVVV